MSTKKNGSMYCSVSLTIQLNSHLFTHSKMIKQFYFKQFSLALVNEDKWFYILLCITNNSIKLSFVYAQLNDQTVLFQTIQFSISQRR